MNKNQHTMQQIIIPERFLNYLYHAFKAVSNAEHHRVKLILRDGRKLRNILVWNGCVLMIEKKVRINAADIEILQIDFDFIPETVVARK